jgi:hypothetical protein
LFKKEYYKAIAKLMEEDVRELRQWVVARFKPELVDAIA